MYVFFWSKDLKFLLDSQRGPCLPKAFVVIVDIGLVLRGA